ncbi:hypothetical protein RUND412_002962 [Rhizina undulata]
MIRAHSESVSMEATGYEKYLLALDPSLQLDADSMKAKALEKHQVVAIANLLKERNARTVGDGQWVLSGLRMALGSEDLELTINFRRYSDDFGDSQSTNHAWKVVENAPNDPAEVSEEIAITPTEEAEMEISRNVIQRPESFDSEPGVGVKAVETVRRDVVGVSRGVAAGFAAEGDETKISGIMIQRPDAFNRDLDTAVGRRSPTPTSDLDSGASTPVSPVVQTKEEIEVDDLDSLEELACDLSETTSGSATALSILRGVLEARKIVMGEEHFETLKTMANLGYWYVRYGWDFEGINLLQNSVEGLKNALGEKNEHTLAKMDKLAQARISLCDYKEAWSLFTKVLEVRMEVLGKNHETILDMMKRLEEIYSQYVVRRYLNESWSIWILS